MEVLGVPLALCAAVLVLAGPGLPTVLALRLRPLTAAAATVPVSVLMVAISAELGHRFDIPWTVLSPLVLGLLLGAVLWPLARRRRGTSRTSRASRSTASADAPGPTDATDATDATEAPRTLEDGTAVGRFLATSRGRATAILSGLAIGGSVILVRALTLMGGIDAVSQTYDNVFHLNGVRRILREGDGSAWVVGGLTRLPGNEAYYPSAWHQLVSLVVQLSGQEIVLASNFVMLLLAAVVWPVGLVAVVRTCTRSGPVGWLAAGALAGITSAYPLSLMAWGLVLPYFLSMSLMPLVMLVAVHVARLAPRSEQSLRPLQLAVLLPAVCGAVALSHPQGVFVGIVLGLPILLWGVLVHGREMLVRVPGAALRCGLLVVVTAVVGFASYRVWDAFRPPLSSAVWEPNASTEQALGQTLSLSPNGTPSWLPLAVVMAVCLVAVLLGSRARWLLPTWLAAAAMSVITRSVPMGDLRYEVTGGWYSDNYRIVAILAVAAIPVLAVGADVLFRLAAGRLPSLRGTAGPVVAVGACLAVLAVSLVSPSTRMNSSNLAPEWRSDSLLSADERELLEQLPEVVPEDAVIATNAWNGSSLAYAISDRQVLNTYMGFQAKPEVHLLNAKLDDAATDPEVCDAAEELHVEYALDFGPKELHGRTATYTGLNEISETGAAEVVLQVGEAKLLRMLPCRGTDGSMNG